MGASAEDKKTFEVGETITVEYKDLESTWIAIYEHEEGRTAYGPNTGKVSYQYAYTSGTGKVEFNRAGQEGVTNHKAVSEDNGEEGFVWYNGPSPDQNIPGVGGPAGGQL